MSQKPDAPQTTAAPAAPAAAPVPTTSAAAQTPAKVDAKPKVKQQYVRSLVGDMRHLVTDDLITSQERKINVDEFAQAQIDAGKWEIVTPD